MTLSTTQYAKTNTTSLQHQSLKALVITHWWLYLITQLQPHPNLGPLHTRDWEPVTSTPQALSLVEKVEPVQVRFTLHLRDQRSRWMQDGCKVYMDSYMASNGSCFMVTWIISYFQKPPLGGRPTTKSGDHGTPNVHNCWFFLFYHVSRLALIKIHWNWHLVEGPITYGFTLHLRVCDHTTWFRRCVGTAFGHFLLGSHNYMVMALGSCVKWPLYSALGLCNL